MSRSRAVTALLLLVALGAPALAQDEGPSFKAQMEAGDYAGVAQTLRQYLDLGKADPALRSYLERNLSYLEAGAPAPAAGKEIILVRGARNDQVYNMPPSSGGEALMLPNTIRYARMTWNKRLNRIGRYFEEATTRSGSQAEAGNTAEHRLASIIYDHASSTANSKKSVMISTSTYPQSGWGPPFYILRVAPERAIFNYKTPFSNEKEVLLPFWILPKEIVAKCETMQQVLEHPTFQQSRFKDLSFGSSGYGSAGNQNNWAVIEQNIREGRNALEGVAGLNSYFPGEGPSVGVDATQAELEKFRRKVEARGGTVEVVGAADLRLGFGAQAKTYLDSSGRPRVLLREGEPVKKLALIDELTHVIQLEQLLKARGPLEVDRLLLRAHGGDPAAKDVVNRWEIRAKRMARMTLPQGDPARASLTRSIEALEAELDPYARYRRVGSGTIDWKRVPATVGRQFAGGVAHFGMALFLKELALVAKTGDKLLIEEFFDGLLTTDFYVEYGLFAVGAAAGDAAYKVFLEKSVARYVRPQFVRSVLRSNVSLALGMALPDLIHGTFDGRAFALDLAGLGLSSAAVKAAVASLRGVVQLDCSISGTALLERISRLKGLTKVGGFLYSAAETAVVLYFGERITRAIDERLRRSEALEAIRDASAAVLDAVRDGRDPDAALTELAAAHRAYRDLLTRPLHEADAQLWQRLERAGLRLSTRDDAVARQMGSYPALEGALARVRNLMTADARAKIELIFQAHEARLETLVPQVYGELAAAELPAEALRSQIVAEDTGGWADALGRTLVRRRLLDEVSELPETRLASYAHEAAFYDGLAQALPEAREGLAAQLERRAREVRKVAELERGLVLGTPAAPDGPADALVEGFVEALEALGPGE